MENMLKDKWWETAIEIISSIWFSQIKPRTVNYIIRKIQFILKDINLDNILEKVKPLVEESEDNVGVIAGIILEVLGEKELSTLREKVVKDDQLYEYISELVFELDLKI